MANVPYSPVSTVDASGGGGTAMSASANPNDFGADIGAAAQKVGDTGFDIAEKQQGMINETTMTNADTALAVKAGEINANYKSLTGLAANAAFPQYQADLEAARQEARANLPPAAQRGFDMLSTKTIASHIIDGSSYAATQLKEANRDSFADSTNVHIQQILQQPAAQLENDKDFQHTLGVITYNTQAQLDEGHPGLQKDPETGNVKFDESKPEGVALKAEYQKNLDSNISQAYVNRYSTLAKQDLTGSYNKYQQDRDSIPRPAQVSLDAYFAPKIFDNNKQVSVGGAIADAQTVHYDMLTNPSSAGSNAYNIGNVKTAEAAANNTAGFAAPATPIDGVTLAANTLRKGYGGLTLQQIGAKWAPPSENQTNDWVANVSKASGFAPGDVPNLNDPTQLAKLVKGIGVAEKSPTDRVNFTDDVISKGVQESLSVGTPSLQQSTQGQKTYATNQNGGPLTLADYYRTHSQDVLAKGDAYAESQMPGDLALKRSVRQSLQNQMQQTISNESAQHLMDNRNVLKAVNGDLSNGVPPQTEDELRKLPGMADMLDNIAARDPKFAESIPTLVAKAARRNDVTNSPNAYGVIQRTLEPHGSTNPDAISSEDHLMKELSRSDELGINMKDYNDAKPAIELPDTLKTKISKQMNDIANANGNLDGKGQQRALAWYNETMKSWQGASGDDKPMSAADFAQSFGKKDGPVPMPDGYIVPRMQAIADAARTAFAKVNGGQVLMRNKDGVTGWMPQANVEKAGSLGYQKVQ